MDTEDLGPEIDHPGPEEAIDILFNLAQLHETPILRQHMNHDSIAHTLRAIMRTIEEMQG